ncbi:CxxC motif protein [Haloarcula virus Hardyhisp2]|uniref:CxxC motif protein n=1 Tax=Haloarcula virus Hardyhisp2 TaxID=2811386 RepID=A0A898KB26_9VIRU|nr:CxxC motif protein [Haloarcula virus Hardyhisp2]QSJ05038.1 CxxC motif protein [Haloarcula virus Hardyhisp2]
MQSQKCECDRCGVVTRKGEMKRMQKTGNILCPTCH